MAIFEAVVPLLYVRVARAIVPKGLLDAADSFNLCVARLLAKFDVIWDVVAHVLSFCNSPESDEHSLYEHSLG